MCRLIVAHVLPGHAQPVNRFVHQPGQANPVQIVEDFTRHVRYIVRAKSFVHTCRLRRFSQFVCHIPVWWSSEIWWLDWVVSLTGMFLKDEVITARLAE
jgi:hypothetical protein